MTRTRMAAGAVAGAALIACLAVPAAASAADSDCVSTTVNRGWVTSTVRVVNDCEDDVRIRILMTAPRPGGFPCVEIPAGYSWSYKYVKAYHVYWGTEFC